MGWDEVASADPQGKAIGHYRSRNADRDSKPAISGSVIETGERLIKRRTMILDMGEGSREQGFRLNGCR